VTVRWTTVSVSTNHHWVNITSHRPRRSDVSPVCIASGSSSIWVATRITAKLAAFTCRIYHRGCLRSPEPRSRSSQTCPESSQRRHLFGNGKSALTAGDLRSYTERLNEQWSTSFFLSSRLCLVPEFRVPKFTVAFRLYAVIIVQPLTD